MLVETIACHGRRIQSTIQKLGARYVNQYLQDSRGGIGDGGLLYSKVHKATACIENYMPTQNLQKPQREYKTQEQTIGTH